MHHEIVASEKKKLLLEIGEVLENEDNGQLIEGIDRHLLGIITILDFNGFGDDKQHDKDFEILCAHLQKESMRNVKDMTIMEFYSLMTNIYDKKRINVSG